MLPLFSYAVLGKIICEEDIHTCACVVLIDLLQFSTGPTRKMLLQGV